jgi:RNA polymerase sigma factor (sigma-70 family)
MRRLGVEPSPFGRVVDDAGRGDDEAPSLAAASDPEHDPIRSYMREARAYPLLTREREVELAKRFEAGHCAVLRALLDNPVTSRELARLEGASSADDGSAQGEPSPPERSRRRGAGNLPAPSRLARPRPVVDAEPATPHMLARLRDLTGRANLNRLVELVATIVARGARADRRAMARTHRAIVEGKRVAEAARGELIRANLRLVMSVAKRYANRGVPFLDLVQEGNIGLMRAVEMFDYRRGFKFSTYAVWWIRQSIARGLAEQSRTIRIPSHMNERAAAVLRATHSLRQALGREPTREEIATYLRLSVDQVRAIVTAMGSSLSLDAPIRSDGVETIASLVEDEASPDPGDAAVTASLGSEVRRALSTLTSREERILRQRFGIDERAERTLQEVGDGFHLTRERIRQLEARALEKLRGGQPGRRLRPFVE